MEEIKLWALRKNEAGEVEVEAISMLASERAENDLEALLVKSPSLLMPNLRLIGRQTPTAGGPLDLLGVDEDGRLVVFELKRGTLYRQAVTQVVDYASSLAILSREELVSRIQQSSGVGGVDKIDDFNAWYQQQHSGSDFVGRPRMVLVGLGADEDTQRMTAFLAEAGADISLVTFYSFEKEGQKFLARRVHVDGSSPPPIEPPVYNRVENLRSLQEYATRLGVTTFMELVHSFLSQTLAGCYWYPGRTGYSYMLVEQTQTGSSSNRQYASLYAQTGIPAWLQLSLHNRAIAAAGTDTFAAMNQEIPEPVRFHEHAKYSIWETRLRSQKDWEMIREPLSTFLNAVLEGRRQKADAVTAEELSEASVENSVDSTSA